MFPTLRLDHFHRIVLQDSIYMIFSWDILQPADAVRKFRGKGGQNRLSSISDLALLWLHNQSIVPQPRTAECQSKKCRHIAGCIDGGTITSLNLDLVVFHQPVVTAAVNPQGIDFLLPKNAIVEGVDVGIAYLARFFGCPKFCSTSPYV